jgi:protein TIF31
MVFRATKHILRTLIAGLQSEHVSSAISHVLNCLLGTGYNAFPSSSYQPIPFLDEAEPTYVLLTPESLRVMVVHEVQKRYRWTIADSDFETLRKPQLLRELASRFAFQIVQRQYDFVAPPQSGQDEKDKAKKGGKKLRTTTFIPEDILCLVPIVKNTAPPVSFFSFLDLCRA